MKHRWTGFLAAALASASLSSFQTPACTTAVVSRSATANGRALLWKNRDADDLHNQVVYCADGRYAYMGLVNRGDVAGLEIWAGMNAAGFAIMNAASYNLDTDKDTKGEGAFMKLALQACATVADFQALLEKTNETGRDVSANFGVIDAEGGASTFETGPHAYKRFNADDPLLAPQGYLVRTNFSESGDREKGSGFVRRDRAVALMEGLRTQKKLTAESLLRDAARDTANSRLGSYPLVPRKKGAPSWAYTADSISRFDTAACVVFEGPAPGEPPAVATAWVILGQPVSGIAVPLWPASGKVPPELAPSAEPAPLNAAFDEVRDQLYPDRRGDLKHYLDLDALTDPKTGLLAPLLAQEDAVFKQVDAATAPWRKQVPTPEAMADEQVLVAKQALAFLGDMLETRRRNNPGVKTGKWKAPVAPGPNGVTISNIEPEHK